MNDHAWIKDTTATGIQYLTVANGLNATGNTTATVWSSENGMNWINLNDATVSYRSLPKRRNAALFVYDGYLVSFGGTDVSGMQRSDLKVSPDHGRTWTDAADNWAFLKMKAGLSGAGVYVQHVADPDNEIDREFIWIMGGTDSDGSTRTVWKAFLNQMLFEHR